MTRKRARVPRQSPSELAAHHPSNYFVRVVRQVRSGVATIVAQEEAKQNLTNPLLGLFLPELNQETTPSQHFGSGFVIHTDGYIITNEHVVRDTSKLSVNLYGYKTPLPARVVWHDSKRDLALIKVHPPTPLKPVRLGSSKTTEVGEWVIAVGNPLGLDHTVTLGVVSGKDRPLKVANRFYSNVIQTDAAINPGNSGGPLINIKGEVIGINTLIIYPSQSIGFAIPIDEVKRLMSIGFRE
ncbi:S1C family serine protease [Mechercharimyces sp. CAU 1602]|uniref:S1C family serine protease n=1 Tax=Mechercharimyces sp. CAU 1602 TaxID=2973933 RepID=UPI002161990E|nr:trypsin-like peptidase domain-containing protein [Mechercharimyces sp. CAU 1602]MCS1350063.1 trypsin-like peptidase domain-containing protein [Mechercharimyces sp. CAU 1602]